MSKLGEVFGVSTQPIASYVERAAVDGAFSSALASDHHIVIYGASKQGKTALRQKHLAGEQCVVVRCGPKTDTTTIYQSLLRHANVKLQVAESHEETISGKAKATWSFRATLPWIGGTDTSAEIGTEAKRQKGFETEFVGHNLADAQSIIELLTAVRFTKYVILENFHYLQEETQRQLAFDLKAFHEVNIRFIVLGIWKEANLLLLHNGDLEGRVHDIPVEPWLSEDFDRVMAKGCGLMNVTLRADAIAELKENAHGNIGLLQDFMKSLLARSGINETCDSLEHLSSKDEVAATLDDVVASRKSRLTQVLDGIAAKSRADHDDPLILPYYLVQVLLTAPLVEISAGITKTQLLTRIRELHHRKDKDTIRTGDVAHLLKHLGRLQENVQPPFLYYDSNNARLRIVDASQLFVLSRIDRESIREEIANPLHTYE